MRSRVRVPLGTLQGFGFASVRDGIIFQTHPARSKKNDDVRPASNSVKKLVGGCTSVRLVDGPIERNFNSPTGEYFEVALHFGFLSVTKDEDCEPRFLIPLTAVKAIYRQKGVAVIELLDPPHESIDNSPTLIFDIES